MSITLKMAFRQVFRRPRQNIAVVLGIALGVSLFVGVQVGSDSLAEGLIESSIHSLGETDAQIYPALTPFVVTPGIFQEELGGPVAPSLVEQLQTATGMENIKAMTKRLDLHVTAVVPDTGSTEVAQTMTGVPVDELGFGDYFDKEGKVLDLADLGNGQIYLGRSIADVLFLDTDPVGQNITLKSTFSSLSNPEFNITSALIDLELNVQIAGIYEDQGRGKENYANDIVSPLNWLQNKVSTRIDVVNSTSSSIILGYGSDPISNILINWDDDISTGDQSQAATDKVKSALDTILGPFSAFFVVQDTREMIVSSSEAAIDSLRLILNVFGSIIILAGVLVIVNIQNMALAAREKETGILRAIGAKQNQIVTSNLLESMFLGVFGSLFGLLGGYLYGRLLIFFLGYALGFETTDIQTVVTASTLITSFVAGFVISQITGIYPAIKASRINVAQVLRGIDPPSQESFGRKSLYFGWLFTILAILMVMNLDPNPILEGKSAFTNLNDAEASYLPIAFLVVGPALLFAYYRSKIVGLSIVGGGLLFWAYFNIFEVFDWIEEGNGGLNYILFIILSLLVGTIIFIAMNLGGIATVGQKFFSWIAQNRKTPIRGTTRVAFKKMRSNVTRSTLTFALFAVILTLNIFIGTWSYSFRYGFDSQIAEVAGGADVMMYTSDNPVPSSIDLSQELLDQFGDASRDVYLTHVKPFTVIQDQSLYLDPTDTEDDRRTRIIAMEQDSLWADSTQSDWIFKWNLADNKTGTPYETYENKPDDPAATQEDEFVWQKLVENATLPNSEGVEKPIIISSIIANFLPTGAFEQVVFPGDSIWLNLTDGSTQEFVVGSIALGNPIMDYATPVDGPPVINSVLFVGSQWKDRLLGFQGYSDYENTFLGKTNLADINSDKIPPLLTEIEKWANQKDGDFRTQYGLFGLVGISVYSIYESSLEAQYRLFGFLQAFTSLGFVVGILGLLVVASRSVTERTREIGMLRALGFRRSDIVVSVVLELIVMGLIGLFIGFINGTLMGYALTDINSGGDATFLIPWGLLGLYAAITLISATVAAIFPAIRASNIPASDALRYTG